MRESEPGSETDSVSHGICDSCAERERAKDKPMSRKKQRQLEDFNETEFFGFAKSYLSEAFPNLQRIGCPPDADLQRMAEPPIEARDAAASEHLTCCSPCFRRYMEILGGLKQQSS